MSRDHLRSVPVTRAHIGQKVRELRQGRRWTQAELADRLSLSQNRLSELERGKGSFTAEQLLEILRLFNVGVSAFDPSPDPAASLQNALARFGARHLREVDGVLPLAEFSRPADVITAVLLEPHSERFLTALAPVVVWSTDDISLQKIQHDLIHAGRPWRLPWLAENVSTALWNSPRFRVREWLRRARRADVLLTAFLDHQEKPTGMYVADILDPGIRSKKSRNQAAEIASTISKQWHILSALQVEDFTQALREASEH